MEIALVQYLTRHTNCAYNDLQESLFESFPGLFTPDDDLLQACLESYGELGLDNNTSWQLRDQDQPVQRRQDLIDVREMLAKIGERLGLRVRERQTDTQQVRTAVGWLDAFDRPLYWFYPVASAVLSDVLLKGEQVGGEKVIVLPGSRANLVMYKLKRDPRLAECCKPPMGWHFLKFRHLRWQLENPLLTRDSLAESLELDPLTYSTPQLRLL